MAINTRIQLKRDTTENWNRVRGTFVPLDGEIIIYTDYSSETYEKDGQTLTRNIPGIKIGTGNAYLGDLPFISSVTQEEIDFWNNKLNCEDGVFQETLIFNRN